MKKEIQKVLVVNCGSSSLKFQLFDMKGETMLCKGLVERIGIAGSRLVYTKTGCEKIVREVAMKNHVEAIAQVMAVLCDPGCGVVKSLGEIDVEAGVLALIVEVVHGRRAVAYADGDGAPLLDDLVEVLPAAGKSRPAKAQCEQAHGKDGDEGGEGSEGRGVQASEHGFSLMFGAEGPEAGSG